MCITLADGLVGRFSSSMTSSVRRHRFGVKGAKNLIIKVNPIRRRLRRDCFFLVHREARKFSRIFKNSNRILFWKVLFQDGHTTWSCSFLVNFLLVCWCCLVFLKLILDRTNRFTSSVIVRDSRVLDAARWKSVFYTRNTCSL